MPNYQNGKIYSIRSHSRPDLVYIGSTVRPLSERFGGHKISANKCKSKQIIDIGDSYIELVENFTCANVEELRKREGHFQRSMDCVNKCIAGRTPQEYNQDNKEDIASYNKNYRQDNKEAILVDKKQYYENNKDDIKTRVKQYNQENKEEIASYHKQYYEFKKEIRICICGVSYNYGNTKDRHKHYQSIKHQKHIQIIHQKLGLG